MAGRYRRGRSAQRADLTALRLPVAVIVSAAIVGAVASVAAPGSSAPGSFAPSSFAPGGPSSPDLLASALLDPAPVGPDALQDGAATATPSPSIAALPQPSLVPPVATRAPSPSHPTPAPSRHEKPAPTPRSSTPAAPPPPPPPPFLLRINAGGGAVTDGGVHWAADQYYVGGTASSGPAAVTSGTPTVDRDERWAAEAYRIPVPREGRYLVRLHLTEIYWREPGKRIFDIFAEGQTVAGGVDMFATSGANTTRIVDAVVKVTDGELTLTFAEHANHSSVTAIEVRSRY